MLAEKHDALTHSTGENARQPKLSQRNWLQTIRERSSVDVCFAALSLALFGLWIYTFRFQHSLAEYDLYSVLDGLLDGARSGTGFASPLHYGKAFSFGYIAAMYGFADANTLQDPQHLIALINSVGFWAAMVGSVCFWLSTLLLYGARVATIAVTLFAFSPMMLDLGTSGHQILLAFAFFAAASVLLFLPVTGLSAVFCTVLGSLLLLASLVFRAEVFLALPFIVLARADLRSTAAFCRSATLRCIGPVLAFAGFFLLKYSYVHLSARETALAGAFFGRWYSLANLSQGVVVYFVGCGFVTTLVGVCAVLRIAQLMITTSRNTESRLALLHAAVGPLALLLPPLAFWIFNPQPVRHFVLCFAGTSILIGWLVTSLLPPPRWFAAYAFVIAVALTNQSLGAFLAPIILQHTPSPWLTEPGRPRLMTRAPIGSSWSFHQKVQAERLRADAFAESVRGTCDEKTIVITDRARQIFSHFYESPAHWTTHIVDLGSLETIVAQAGRRKLMVVTKLGSGWSHDAVAEILADPALAEYRLVRDPETISIYDKTPIPPNRLAHLGCTP